jgi:hypothetical protein
MAKQEINIGTAPNSRNGDSLRAAFSKINSNFTELYTALGLNSDITLNLGAFEFTGSTMTTSDSTPITIDQATSVTSDLTVGGDILPSENLSSTLGSPTNKFHSLYVGTGSVYIGDARLSLEGGTLNSSVGFSTDNLTVGGVSITVNENGALLSSGGFVGAVAGSVEWDNVQNKPTIPDVSNFITAEDIPAIPADISDLTDTEGLLGGSPTNVKLESPDDRRIEEVYGYNEVSVTEPGTVNLTTTASRDSDDIARIWIDTTTTTIDEILDDTDAAGITDTATIEFSVDNTTWYTRGGTWFDGDERGYGVNIGGDTLTYSQGDTVYFRYVGGGAPVVWWDKDDLPGGGSDFRGAVIDYHAYTGESTIIGTIHIVDDDGEDHITHTEVQSGSTDGENDDLWVVTTEGQIKYRRIDGESKTLKIQWAAKVFYGSEAYD